MTRQKALETLSKLPKEALEAFAVLAETADVQGDFYVWNDKDSTWEDSAQRTLSDLAEEVRSPKRTVVLMTLYQSEALRCTYSHRT